jgi:sec-independent protein translocase protein TatA
MFFANLAGSDTVIVVIVIAVVLFGGSAIPKLARNLGSAKKEFEKGIKEAQSSDTSAANTSTTDEK